MSSIQMTLHKTRLMTDQSIGLSPPSVQPNQNALYFLPCAYTVYKATTASPLACCISTTIFLTCLLTSFVNIGRVECPDYEQSTMLEASPPLHVSLQTRRVFKRHTHIHPSSYSYFYTNIYYYKWVGFEDSPFLVFRMDLEPHEREYIQCGCSDCDKLFIANTRTRSVWMSVKDCNKHMVRNRPAVRRTCFCLSCTFAAFREGETAPCSHRARWLNIGRLRPTRHSCGQVNRLLAGATATSNQHGKS